MVYNCDFEYVSLIVCIMMFIFVKIRYIKTDSIRKFEYLLVSTMVCMVLHIAFAALADYAKYLPMWVCQVVGSGFFVFFILNLNYYFEYCVSYISGGLSSHNHFRIFNGFMAFSCAIMMLINAYNPIVFYFDVTKPDALVWLPMFKATITTPVIYTIIAVIVSARYRKDYIRRQLFAVISYAFFMVLGSILQVFVIKYTLCLYFFVMLALLLILFSLETPDFEKLNQTMQELYSAKDEAERATKAKSAFLARMSHEIRTPINAILGLDEMIIRESRDAGIKKYALDVRNSGQSLLTLINDILDFSKIESGKMEIVSSRYDLAEMLRETEILISQRAKAKNLDFYVNVDPEVPRFLRGDENRIRQIIVNLLTNGVKYTQKGQVTINVSYEKIEDVDNRVMLKFAIRDTGIGIKAEDMDTIFRPFERVSATETKKIEGTGLGISITEQLLALMGSKLEVESEYGKGSTFSFCLEQEIMEWTYLGDYEDTVKTLDVEKAAFVESFTAPGARILVIDDIPVNLTVVKGLLKNSQMTIDSVTSGKEALYNCSKVKYHLILVDHMMPEMDGIETARRIREDEDSLNKETPLVALTANAISGAKEYYLSEGFSSYISKPLVPAELENVIVRFLPVDMIKEAPTETIDSGETADVLSKLEEIPEINMPGGIAASGSPEIYVQVSEEFYETIDTRSEMIENYYKSDDIENYVIQVHALKSTARLVGYSALSTMAAELEAKGKAGDVASIRERTEDLLMMYRGIKKPLEEVFGTEDDPKKPLISEIQLRDAIRTIYACEENFDTEMAESVFEQLSGYRMPEEFIPVYKKLKAYLADVSRDEILDLLKDMK